MALYNIRFGESGYKDIKNIPQKDITKMLARIKSLAIEPRPYGCEKLTG
jgi:mRNA interferase RelE/StbE